VPQSGVWFLLNDCGIGVNAAGAAIKPARMPRWIASLEQHLD
jgi:hypothetical protein